MKQLIEFKIAGRNEKSLFHNRNITINLPFEFALDAGVMYEWFDNDICFEEATGKYKHEEYIVNLIEMLDEMGMNY